MKKIIISIILASFCLFCYGQNKIEPLAQILSSKVFNADSVYKNAYEFAKLSPFNLRELMPLQYSSINAGFNYDKGNFMQAQNSAKIKDTYLKTEGSTQLGSIALWGLFSYHKTFEDSTMYNHQTRNNVSAPYYFGSPINVSYERSVYNLSALAEKNIIKKNLPIGIGADYRIGNHFSTNDPRGAISDFQLNLVSTIGYTFFNRLKLGAAYRYGYGQERFSVDYKNNSFSQIVLLPAYNNYLVNGYGEAYVKNIERDYNNDQTRNGFDTYINFESSALGNFYFSYSHIQEKQKYLRSNSLGRSNFNNYDLDKDSYNLLWLKTLGNKKISTNLIYNNINGKDLNYIYLANNYLYQSQQIGFKSILTVKKHTNMFNYFLSVYKNGEQRKDGLTGNDVKYNNLDLTGGFGYNKTTAKQCNWGFDLTGIYTKPLNNDLTVQSINAGQFTQRVIYYDYIYNTSSRIGGGLNADFSFPAFDQIQAGIKFGISYVNRLKIEDNNYPFIPGKDRFSSNISLNLYF